jgi:hypothetical protein
MTTEQARKNIGKEFKWQVTGMWDTIREVSQDGMITGDKTVAPAEQCRLKQDQPDQFKKKQSPEFDMIPGAPDIDAMGNCYSDADPGL